MSIPGKAKREKRSLLSHLLCLMLLGQPIMLASFDIIKKKEKKKLDSFEPSRKLGVWANLLLC